MTWNDSSRPLRFPCRGGLLYARGTSGVTCYGRPCVYNRLGAKNFSPRRLRLPARSNKAMLCLASPPTPSCARKPSLPVTALWCLSNRSGLDKSSPYGHAASVSLPPARFKPTLISKGLRPCVVPVVEEVYFQAQKLASCGSCHHPCSPVSRARAAFAAAIGFSAVLPRRPWQGCHGGFWARRVFQCSPTRFVIKEHCHEPALSVRRRRTVFR